MYEDALFRFTNKYLFFFVVFFYSPSPLLSLSPKVDTLRFEGVPSTIINDVHVITGDYCEREADISIKGTSPLNFTRTYYSGLAFGGAVDTGTLHGFWSHNHYGAVYLLAGRIADKFFTHKGGKVYNYHAYAFDSNASTSFYERTPSKEPLSVMDFQLKYGVTNHSFFTPDAPNWKSQHLDVTESKNGKCFITDGKGGVKSFKKAGKYTHLLQEERLSSGNRISYEFKKYNDLLPKRVATYDKKNNTCINWMNFNFKSLNGSVSAGKWYVDVNASNGQFAKYSFSKASGAVRMYHLMSVESSYLPKVEYEYNSKWRLTKRKLPHHRHKAIEYYSFKGEGNGYYNTTDFRMPIDSGKVKLLKAPVGSNNDLLTTDSFSYFCDPQMPNTGYSGRTEHIDALGNKTIYFFSTDHRLQKIEKYSHRDKEKPSLTECYHWGAAETHNESNLLCKTIKDSTGKIHATASYKYDGNGNLIEHALWGDITGKREGHIILKDGTPAKNCSDSITTKYTYNYDNLMESKQKSNGKKTFFTYYPGTSLLKDSFVFFNNIQKTRTFYSYDSNGTSTETISDNGSSRHKEDLHSVTERHIQRIVPSKEEASRSLPKVIEEKYLDLSSNMEKLLSKTVHTYDKRGRILRSDFFNANNIISHSIYKHYDVKGRLVKEDDTRGKSSSSRYDDNGNIVYSKGQKGLETFYNYDFSNRLTRMEQHSSDGESRTGHYEYDYLGNRTAKTDPQQNTTHYEYDRFGCITKMLQPTTLDENGTSYRPETKYSYNALQHLVTKINPKGELTRKKCNIYGKPISITYSDGTCEKFEYTLEGLLSKKIEKDRSCTTFTYDYQGRELKNLRFDPNGNVIQKTQKKYDAFHLVKEIDPEGLVIMHYYDGAGRLLRQQKGEYEIHFTYDAHGNQNSIEKKIDNKGHWHRELKEYDLYGRVIRKVIDSGLNSIALRENKFSYDNNDRCIKEVALRSTGEAITQRNYNSFNELSSYENAQGNKWTLRYLSKHKNGSKQNVRQKIETDPNNHQIKTTYDSLGKVSTIERVDSLGLILDSQSFFYDKAGNKSRLSHQVYYGGTPDKDISTIWEYGPLNRLEKMREGAGSKEEKISRYFFDIAGRLCRSRKPNGIELFYSYDGAGRRASLSSSDKSIHYKYSYDNKNRPVAVNDLVNSRLETYQYDELGFLTRTTLANSLEILFELDFQGRRQKVTLPDSSGIRYDFDAVNLLSLKRVNSSDTILYQHFYSEYDLSGHCHLETLAKSTGAVHVTYDPLGRAIRCQHPHFSWKAEEFDAVGNLLAQRIETPQDVYSFKYKYDSLYQLTSEEGLFKNRYNFDSLHNRRNKNGGEYDVNKVNELLSEGATSYVYDKCGNLIEKKSPLASIQYSYDALNRLHIVKDGNTLAKYTYDSNNRRMDKQLWKDGALISSLRFIYLGENEIGAVDDSEKVVELRLLGESSIVKQERAVALELYDKVYIPLHDCRGSISALINTSTGDVEERYYYSAFGEEKAFDATNHEIPNSIIGNFWRYSGKRIDEETGLLYFGQRYYNQQVGRWLTCDPAGYVDGPNLYAYVANRPLLYFDPYGLFSVNPVLHKQYSLLSKNVKGMGQKDLSRIINYASRDLGNKKVTLDGLQLKRGRISFGNGIFNTLSEHKKSAEMISRLSGGYAVTGIYNDSRGPGALKAVFESVGYKTSSVMNLRTEFCRSFLDFSRQRSAGENVKHMHVSHSQGGIQAKHALTNLPKPIQQHIEIFNINGGKIVPGKYCSSASNIQSSRDFVSLSDLGGQIQYRDQIQVIKAHPDASWIDHAISSPTVTEPLESKLNDFTNLYK
jgi:RHS repeat-associated protein